MDGNEPKNTTPWTKEWIERLKQDRRHDDARMMPAPRIPGAPDPREANRHYIDRRDRMIRRYEQKMQAASMKLGRDFDQSR